jgi:hypothetical protein
MAMILALLLALGGDRSGAPAEDFVDLIEVNVVCNEYGNPVLAQLIFWDWSKTRDTFVVVDFQMLSNV